MAITNIIISNCTDYNVDGGSRLIFPLAMRYLNVALELGGEVVRCLGVRKGTLRLYKLSHRK